MVVAQIPLALHVFVGDLDKGSPPKRMPIRTVPVNESRPSSRFRLIHVSLGLHQWLLVVTTCAYGRQDSVIDPVQSRVGCSNQSSSHRTDHSECHTWPTLPRLGCLELNNSDAAGGIVRDRRERSPIRGE